MQIRIWGHSRHTENCAFKGAFKGNCPLDRARLLPSLDSTQLCGWSMFKHWLPTPSRGTLLLEGPVLLAVMIRGSSAALGWGRVQLCPSPSSLCDSTVPVVCGLWVPQGDWKWTLTHLPRSVTYSLLVLLPHSYTLNPLLFNNLEGFPWIVKHVSVGTKNSWCLGIWMMTFRASLFLILNCVWLDTWLWIFIWAGVGPGKPCSSPVLAFTWCLQFSTEWIYTVTPRLEPSGLWADWV